MAETYILTPVRRLANVVMRATARLGLGDERTHVLTVVGRVSGRRYSVPVNLVFHGGERWLVSPYGDRPWVRNARAAGWVELTRRLHSERVQIEEVAPDEAAPVLKEYLRANPITKAFFDAEPDAPVEAFAAEARRHPVFRLVRA